MATWDVFHSDRLEVERGLSTSDVRSALARGDLRDDDLVRPAGTTVPWARIGEMPALVEPELEGPPPPRSPVPEPPDEPPAPVAPKPPIATSPVKPKPKVEFEQEFDVIGDLDDLRFAVNSEPEPVSMPMFADDFEESDDDDDESPLTAMIVDEDDDEPPLTAMIVDEDDDERAPRQALPADFGELDLDFDRDAESASQLALPVLRAELEEEFDPQDEDEEAAGFTLSRSGPETVEELDLAAMVDVAFQLVLFFLVTATTVLYKSLEIPKPNPESKQEDRQQGASRNLNDLQNDYIVVEIDSGGAMKVDRESVAPNMTALIERLRAAREKTGRKAMLLSADYSTQHRNAVMAYDAANEIGLGIAIARPMAPTGAAPAPAALRTPAKAVKPGGPPASPPPAPTGNPL